MNGYYRNTKKDEELYAFCKNEGVNYRYLLYELRNEKKAGLWGARGLRKLIRSICNRFR